MLVWHHHHHKSFISHHFKVWWCQAVHQNVIFIKVVIINFYAVIVHDQFLYDFGIQIPTVLPFERNEVFYAANNTGKNLFLNLRHYRFLVSNRNQSESNQIWEIKSFVRNRACLKNTNVLAKASLRFVCSSNSWKGWQNKRKETRKQGKITVGIQKLDTWKPKIQLFGHLLCPDFEWWSCD